MNPNELIGKAEGPLLEFKAAEVLKDPRKVAREVVAMLNASNGTDVGEIWIGIGERESRAFDLHGLTDAEAQRGRLRDSLVDTIEPQPTSEEVSVDVVDGAAEGSLLRVRVLAGTKRKPFALLRDNGRHYFTRVQDRTSMMPYDRLRDAWLTSSEPDAVQVVPLKRLAELKRDALRRAPPRLWIGVVPHADQGLDLEAGDVQRLLTDPGATGNREHGWTYVRRHFDVAVRQNRREVGDETHGLTRLWRTGDIEFEVKLEALTLVNRRGFAERNELSPLALLEFPTSVLRLASAIARSRKPSRISVALAIMGVRGWKLWPYAPDAAGWREAFFGVGTYEDGDDLVLNDLTFEAEQILEEPDRCAYRLVLLLYEAFHLSADKIPRVFDPKAGRLNLE